MGINDIANMGKAIKILRTELGISQKEMAKLIGVAPSTYSGYETNYRQPNDEILDKIATVFGTNSTMLVFFAVSLKLQESGKHPGLNIELNFEDPLFFKATKNSVEDDSTED